MGKILRGIKYISEDLSEAVLREINFHRARPTTATLFLTYRCNSKCNTCTLWKRSPEEEKKRELDFKGWKVIIDKLAEKGLDNVEIFGGNVLIRKELLRDVLRYLKEKSFCIHMPTNQIGLDDETAKTIVDTVDFVYISTDGVDDYQDMIRGQKGASQRTDTAIAKFLKLRGGRKSPVLICNTTVSKYNAGVLERIAEYAVSKGFDQIHFEYAGEMTDEQINDSIINGLKPTPYYVRQNESILVDRESARLLKGTIRSIRRKYRGRIHIRSINIDVLSENNLSEGTIPHSKCYVERNEVTVDPSGNVIICPFINNYVLGNLLDERFDRIWNNGRHREFRSLQNRGDIKICEHCILGVQRNPSFFTSIKRMYLQRVQPFLNP